MFDQDRTTIDCSCAERPDPDALMRAAETDRNLFLWGTLVDDDGRQTVIKLMQRGYARGTAMRIALQAEASRV